MKIYKCIKEFPGGPKEGDLLPRGNYVYEYTPKGTHGKDELAQKLVENSPEFFKEVKVIVNSFKNQHNGNVYKLNVNKFPEMRYERNTTSILYEDCIDRYKIHSVLHAERNNLYTVGNHVLYNGHGNRPLKIEAFKYHEKYKDSLMAKYAGGKEWYDDYIEYCNPFDYDEEEKKETEKYLKEYPMSCKDIIDFLSGHDHRFLVKDAFYDYIKQRK